MKVRLSVVAEAVCDRVLSVAEQLNRLDGVAGDGDLGITMTAAAKAVMEVAPGLDDTPLHESLRDLGTTIARRAPSTAGTLVATAFLAMARVTSDEADEAVARAARRLAAAQEAIESRGGAHPGDKTMLDALAPAVQALRASARDGQTWQEALDSAAAAAREGAEETRGLRAQVGRAGWLADRSAGSPDAGAILVAVVIEAVRDVLAGSTGAGQDDE
jgi:triose/dihydroxyacetone kinase / FAD-AMP lyase (cyclizing)